MQFKRFLALLALSAVLWHGSYLAHSDPPHTGSASDSIVGSDTEKKLLWQSRFDSQSNFTDWHVKNIQYGSNNFAVVKDDLGKFNHVLRVDYPKGSWSPVNTRKAGVPVGGLGFLANCGIVPEDKIHLRYFLKFSPNFNFVKGGKLPGVYGGTANSGGKQANGKDGFSVRLMWRRHGEGEVYAYLPGSKLAYGTSIGRGQWRFVTGRWMAVELEVQLNSPGKDDGIIRMWIDDKPVITQTGLRFRDTPDLKIDGIMFSTFFGGNDASWSTPTDVSVNFADFALAREFIGSTQP